MPTKLSLLTRQARLTAIRSAIDGGGGAGKLLLYAGAIPMTPEVMPAGELLATIELAPTSGSIGMSGGVATYTLLVPRTANAMASGIATFGRFASFDDVSVLDADVGAIGSGAPIIMSDINIFAGGEVQLISCVISE